MLWKKKFFIKTFLIKKEKKKMPLGNKVSDIAHRSLVIVLAGIAGNS